jgi:predicted AlkP superfamily phosphohydrolase/phosphomutase
MAPVRRVVVIGLDGLEPTLVEPMLAAGELPHLARLREAGGYSRVQTTCPAQTPVAWSTFATGVNPGGHGIYDFLRRDPGTYLPDFGLNRYEQKNIFSAPRAVNLRRGTPVWEVLSAAGIAATILRCPCTYPPDNLRGLMLSGMGVPDLRGSLGTATFYTSDGAVKAQESESVVPVSVKGNTSQTHLLGPRNPRTRAHFTCDLTLQLNPANRQLTVCSEGQPRTLQVAEGAWSEWLKVKFKTGLLQAVSGMVRFHLVRLEPVLELYASPINFDPDTPLFPISSPPTYARELAAQLGTFYTTGMVEDHGGLNNGRFDEAAYLDQCAQVLRERERMMLHELERLREGLFFCLFDTPDRVQHMFWRFREPEHPANARHGAGAWEHVIREHYRACDVVVGKALQYSNTETLCIVLSDHGFNSFRRGVNLNTWLHDHGLLALQDCVQPGEEASGFFRHIDWGRTSAYALGLAGIYLNLQGREGQGTVELSRAEEVKTVIIRGLTGLVDPEHGQVAVRSVVAREQVYSGPYVAEAPDLIVNCSPGYRVSWGTALGGVPRGTFEDNTKKWGGDHIIDPAQVPGVLFMNRPFRGDGARLLDLAPTMLAALGVPKHPAMEGGSILR